MEKSKMRPVKAGRGMRMSFSREKEVLAMPNLIEIQKNSYEWFLGDGLREVFHDIFPIEDFAGHLSLDFVDFRLCRDDVKYSIEECKERDATYAAPIRVKVRLCNNDKDEINEHEIFMGDLPLMTDTGSFVINGAERVIVSQLVRSPGIYYTREHDKLGKELFFCQVIPNRGAWIEYETDSNDVFFVRVDRTRKVPVTVLCRALGLGTNTDILEMFGEEPKIMASLQKDSATCYEEGLLELYKKIRPGEPLSVDSAENLFNAMFFDPRRYDLARVGRYKFNKKLNLKYRLNRQTLAEDVIDVNTGEILATAGTKVDKALGQVIQDAAVPYVWVEGADRKIKVLSNLMVDITKYVDIDDPREYGIYEPVYWPLLKELMDSAKDKEELLDAIRKEAAELVPKHITKEDIFASINYCMHVEFLVGSLDDIDHLGNRRIRAVGELLQNQYRIGLSRMERVVRERMQTQDIEAITPQSLVNIKPVTAAVKEFFGSSQLSQFMDQNNPLSELTHKRRLSALGPGGLNRDRATFEVRDVHYSHYGRMCPIETPEGPNIGLIGSLSTYARINEYGFIEAPYRKYDKETGCVTGRIDYLMADMEDQYIVAQANEPLDEQGRFLNKKVVCRFRDQFIEVPPEQVDYLD
ncbi:MAG: DNA-directed RNA polymerase subunit beta, partial [Clostridiales bacterium]|nr:DNA-directed RNA polymerase subunit beta [Clostridiales bacterium]